MGELETKLHLRLLRHAKTMMNAFVSNSLANVRESKVVEVCVRSQFDGTEYVIEVTTIPVICQDIATLTQTTGLRKMREDKKKLADGVLFAGVPTEAGMELYLLVHTNYRNWSQEKSLEGKKHKYWSRSTPERAGQPKFLSDRSQVIICILRVSGRIEQESTFATPHSFWELYSMETFQCEQKPDDQTLERFQNESKENGDHYEVVFPCNDREEERLEGKHQTAGAPTVQTTQRNSLAEAVWASKEWRPHFVKSELYNLSADEPSPNIPRIFFLVGYQLTVLPKPATTKVSTRSQSTRADPVSRLSHRQRLVKCFWNGWKNGHMLQFRRVHQSRNRATRTLEIDDIVMVEDATRPKLLWDFGEIVEAL